MHALCIMGDIEDAESVEEATAEAVQSWFDAALSAQLKDISERVDAALAAVEYKHVKEDPAGGVTNFIVKVIRELDQNNASSVLKDDKDLAKGFINKLTIKFKDTVLRERIKMRRQGWTKDQLADIKFFCNEVGKIAVDLELTMTARKRVGLDKPRR